MLRVHGSNIGPVVGLNAPVKALLFAWIFVGIQAEAQDVDSFGFRRDVATEVTDSYDKLIDLAHAFPDDLFSWRPAEGVRSVSEVLIHSAVAGYYFSSVAGSSMPDDLDLLRLEADITAKKDVIEALSNARDLTLDVLVTMDESFLADTVEWMSGTIHTVRATLLVLSNHTAEHLGQMIAYARMNGVAPPWSEE